MRTVICARLLAGLAVCAAVLAGCSAPAPPPPISANPISAAPTPPGGEARRLNLDEIFPLGEGRDLVLENCTACHSFVRIVLGKKEQGRWEAVKGRHRDRVRGLGDEDFDRVFAYVSKNFDSTQPEPKLPQWFVEAAGY